MAEAKKSNKKAKPIADVQKPGTSAASTTSKSVIVTNRPIMKDPMVVDEEAKTEDKPQQTVAAKKSSTKSKIQPLESSPQPEPEAEPQPEVTETAEPNPEKSQPEKDSKTTSNDEPSPDKTKNTAKQDKKSVEENEELKAKQEAEHDANLQKIVDAKTYYLPINAVEKRKTKRFVLLGILLSVLLILIWINIALDAELITIDGIRPLTDFL